MLCSNGQQEKDEDTEKKRQKRALQQKTVANDDENTRQAVRHNQLLSTFYPHNLLTPLLGWLGGWLVSRLMSNDTFRINALYRAIGV